MGTGQEDIVMDATGIVGAQVLEEASKRRLAVEEFLIDLIGGFIPGLLFLGATAFAFIPPLYALVQSAEGIDIMNLLEATEKFITSTQNTPSVFWILVLIGGGGLAYVVGHLFYRQDPDVADQASFRWSKHQLRSKAQSDITRELACEDESQCEFPYPAMDQYLEERGFHHLQPLVLWKTKNGKLSPKSNYVNLLKTRLRYHYPDKCGAVIRNEAHVRLAASSWSIAWIVIYISVVGLAIATISIFIPHTDGMPWHSLPHLAHHASSIIAPLTVLGFAGYAQRMIRKFLHHQRLREIVYVLETAYTAYYLDPQSKSLGHPFP